MEPVRCTLPGRNERQGCNTLGRGRIDEQFDRWIGDAGSNNINQLMRNGYNGGTAVRTSFLLDALEQAVDRFANVIFDFHPDRTGCALNSNPFRRLFDADGSRPKPAGLRRGNGAGRRNAG